MISTVPIVVVGCIGSGKVSWWLRCRSSLIVTYENSLRLLTLLKFSVQLLFITAPGNKIWHKNFKTAFSFVYLPFSAGSKESHLNSSSNSNGYHATSKERKEISSGIADNFTAG